RTRRWPTRRRARPTNRADAHARSRGRRIAESTGAARGGTGNLKGGPSCCRLYSAEAGYCQADGAALRDVDDLSIPADRSDARVWALLVGRYRVFRPVADGGMGRNYEAFDTRAREHRALMLLHPEFVDDPVSVER